MRSKTTTMMALFQLLVVVAQLSFLLPAVTAKETEIHHGDAMVKWLTSEDSCPGGFFSHDKVDIRRVDARTYGLFAKADIEEDEVLMEIPRRCVVAPRIGHLGDRIQAVIARQIYMGDIIAIYENEETGEQLNKYDVLFEDGEMWQGARLTDQEVNHAPDAEDKSFVFAAENPLHCSTARHMRDELLKANNSEPSHFSAYAHYLLDTQNQDGSLLPSTWSKESQLLLQDVIGRRMHAPDTPFMWTQTEWYGECNGDREDDFATWAAMLVVLRSWDEVMIPVYDMVNHRNGHWQNMDSNQVHDTDENSKITVMATRDVQAGEQLYISYNFCRDCQGRYMDYGTPEIVRDYGFVEDYPRRFVFDQKMGFDLDHTVKSDESTPLQLTWIRGQKPRNVTMAARFVEDELMRLQDLQETVLAERDVRIESDREWSVIGDYVAALIEAFQYALQACRHGHHGGFIKVDDGPDETTCGDDNPTCALTTTKRRYDSLEWEEEKWVTFRPDTCAWEEIYEEQNWEISKVLTSHYQTMEFKVNKKFEKDDACLNLDEIVQICQSYRPHYHETIVHYTARFLPEIKRVVFVGGGDSMLLHDIIKYPTLEKVIGLEIDQLVTRNSFWHFGTQPHFDNDKVEWWFGDATKSLLMLPTEYFNSFDMVLVDLSETVASMSVTDELDIMRALTLLLKDDGIFVKNEIMYFQEMKEIFPHTLHIHFDKVPFVCSQQAVLGSKTAIFPRLGQKDHGIPTLYRKLDEDYHEIMHSYEFNKTNLGDFYCGKSKGPTTEQEKSPGIMMVLEAEDMPSSANIESVAKVEAIVTTVLKKQGLTVVSTKVMPGNTLLVVLKEGYVVTHSFPEHKYCGFDIMLWSDFGKTDSIKKALSDTFDSQVTSSYRIVTGGMFGVSSWKDDEATRGPESARRECSDDDTASQISERPPDEMLGNVVLNNLADLIVPSNATVGVMCGLKSEPCKTMDMLKEQRKDYELIPIWTYDELTQGVEFAKDGAEQMFECQKKLYRWFESTLVDNDKKLDAIVVDGAVSYPMGQVADKLLTNERNAHRWLVVPNITVLAPLSWEGTEWRRSFVEAFRKEVVVFEPVFSGMTVFNNSESSLSFFWVSAGSFKFFGELDEILKRIEDSTGLEAEVSSIRGGKLLYDADFHPTQVFDHNDFDNSDAMKQWQSQKPLGFQEIFQLEGRVLSCDWLANSVTKVMEKLNVDDATTEEQSLSEGDGCMVTVQWAAGHAIVLWDGRDHVDFNLYLHKEDKEFADDFTKAFAEVTVMKVTLRDIQPRGPGRVMNHQSDIDATPEPIWKPMEE